MDVSRHWIMLWMHCVLHRCHTRCVNRHQFAKLDFWSYYLMPHVDHTLGHKMQESQSNIWSYWMATPAHWPYNPTEMRDGNCANIRLPKMGISPKIQPGKCFYQMDVYHINGPPNLYSMFHSMKWPFLRNSIQTMKQRDLHSTKGLVPMLATKMQTTHREPCSDYKGK